MTKENSNSAQQEVQVMVWYKEEDWDTLMSLFPDSHLMPKNFGEWLSRAEEVKKQVEASGTLVIKVFIDPETFPAWCREEGRKMDADARTELAIKVAQQQTFRM